MAKKKFCSGSQAGVCVKLLQQFESEKLPDGLIAQLVEQCTGITEAMG